MTELTEIKERTLLPRLQTLRQASILSLTALVATVWLYHGLYNKLLGGETRHLRIIQSIPGLSGAVGQVALAAVGAFEVLLALWIISGRAPRSCAAVQTIALLSMNLLELRFARSHLLWPAMLVPVNLLFLTLAWTVAELQQVRRAETSIRSRAADASTLYRLRRHPLPIDAHFRHCLVLTYALDPRVLAPLLPPGLILDTFGGHAFLAVALVQTQDLRPAGAPKLLGQDFFLAGYRVFTKFRTSNGRTLRGLRILRSDGNRRRMIFGGNLLTHYNYHLCDASVLMAHGRLAVDVRTPGAAADISVLADLNVAGELPAGSPFDSLHEAMRFAGPLPYTFDYEPQTHSIIAIKGVRENWHPRLVNVRVERNTFLEHAPFAQSKPVLASAFYVGRIDYRWLRGERFELPEVTS